jgi:hypothetical protein
MLHAGWGVTAQVGEAWLKRSLPPGLPASKVQARSVFLRYAPWVGERM